MADDFSKEKEAALAAITGLKKKLPGSDEANAEQTSAPQVKPAGADTKAAAPPPPPKVEGHGQVSQHAPLTSLKPSFSRNSAGVITPPATISVTNSINEIFVFARSKGASDIHLCMNAPITFRLWGELKTQGTEILTGERMKAMCIAAFPPLLISEFERYGDLEFVHSVGKGRYRVALTKERYGWDLTARVIPDETPTLESTGLPPSTANLTKWSQGLVLVTGPAGCGKSTSMAALVELVNKSRHDHIITIENPIEIIYEPKSCQITQRELSTHTLSQANALRAALREDPDILVISELRDLESISLAVTAAETGHLVFGTMNTTNAAQTVSRIIDSFPADEQSVIRNMISESLRGVICQQLIPRKDGKGLVPAFEVLVVNSAVSNLIRLNKISQITNAITTGKSQGMILLDHSLEEMIIKGQITAYEAMERALNPHVFANYM